MSAACDDPLALEWFAVEDTAALYSIADARPNLVNAFDFVNGVPVILERPDATGTWDVALGTGAEGLVFLPPGALGVSSEASVAVLDGVAFADLFEAPADSALYTKKSPVPVRLGTTYVIRTRTAADYYGTTTCSFYAKLAALSVNVRGGVVRFVYTTNPNCLDRRLTP